MKAALHNIMNAENRDAADLAIDQFEASYGAKYAKAVDKVLKDRDVLLTHFEFPAEHWIHLSTTNVIESTFATVKLRTRKTKGAGSRAAGLAMAYKLLEAAQARWRCVNAPPPGRTCSRWGDLRGWIHHRARGPAVRRVITPGRSTTF
jgi:putative transposase